MSLCPECCVSCCCTTMYDAYEDGRRETYNSLLRIKTPFPKRTDDKELDVRIASCVCQPLRMIEGVGMIACGALLWPIPCTVCTIKTEHFGTSVEGSCCLGFRRPNIPCHFKDEINMSVRKENSEITEARTVQGNQMPCSCGFMHPQEQENPDQRANIFVKSSVTGYSCISSGIGKIINSIILMACCPIACCQKNCS